MATPAPEVCTLSTKDRATLITVSLHPPTNTTLTLSRADRTLFQTFLPPLGDASFTFDQDAYKFISDTYQLSIMPLKSSFRVRITTRNEDIIEMTTPLRKERWYGLGQVLFQHWPLEKGSLELSAFYPYDNGPSGMCTMVEPTVFSSNGGYVSIDESSTCLHLGLNGTKDEFLAEKPLIWTTGLDNLGRKILPAPAKKYTADGMLRVQSRRTYDWDRVQHPWLGNRVDDRDPELQFVLSGHETLRGACEMNLKRLKEDLGERVIPPVDMMRYPIWSTWARYHDAVTQKDVIEFAEDIVKRGLNRSVMGIDDRWSIKYGDLAFDPVKFPDPKQMIRRLHELGFKVTLWVTPFANANSKAVNDETSRKYFVKDRSGKLAWFKWWQPTMVCAVDVTNPEAREWFVSCLQRLCDEYGVDGFKFDAGEPCFLPKDCVLHCAQTPQDYTRDWINEVAGRFELCEVRSGVRGCQNASPMFRIFDRFSNWSLQNGLASVLAAVLTSGMLGYSFCIPDYIAGNEYADKAEKELMIRWAQVSCCMPAMQFSIPPWSFDDECESLCERVLKWRELFFWDKIQALLKGGKEYVPMCRPMWWAADEVDDVYDQFLLGDDIVIAPVLNKDQRERDVFLPAGEWKRVDLDTGNCVGKAVVGPKWIHVQAPLGDLPTFALT